MPTDNGIKAVIKGKTLTITTTLGKGKLSSTGKSYVVATSGGFMDVPGAGKVKLNLSVITPLA